LAVTGVMVVTTVLFAVVARKRWQWSWWLVAPVITVLLSIDLLFLASNSLKILDGGWMPLAVAAVVLWIVALWRRGVRLVNRSRLEDGLPMEQFLSTLGEVERFPGTGVFFARDTAFTPITIRKLQRHIPTLPETILVVHLQALGVPRVPFHHRLRLEDLGHGVWSATVRFGYLQRVDMPSMITEAAERGVPTEASTVTYWVRRDQVSLTGRNRGLTRWRASVFAFLLRNANVLPDMLDLPPRRTVEIGMRSAL
jgi:KUP system potassium uptake protein